MNKFSVNIKKLMTYFGMSLIFMIIGYLVLFFVLQPVINIVVPVWKMVNLSAPYNSEQEEEEKEFEASSVFGGTVKASEIDFPYYGDRYATLKIPTANIDAPVYWGDGDKQLKKGLGHYIGSNYPGMGSTSMIAGHNHTFLHTIDAAKVGDEVILTTSYGMYIYEINEVKVASKDDASLYDLGAEYENLVLYTCYPLSTLGLTSKRYYVLAKLKSGPSILINE